MSKKPAIKSTARIAIAGCGGLGSHLIHLLYDFGVNRNQFPYVDYDVVAFDPDIIEVSNLLHQNYTSNDLGKKKADIMAARYFVKAETRKMEEKDFQGRDIILCCVDNLKFRNILYTSSKAPFWIDGRCNSHQIAIYNASNNKDVLKASIAGADKAGDAGTGCLREVDKVNKISHVTPVVVAGIMMQQFLNWIRGEENPNPIQMYI